MISFKNEVDNKIIRSLIKPANEIEKTNLGDLLHDTLIKNKGRAIIFDISEERLILVYEQEASKEEFLSDLLNFVSLISYLISNNLVFIHENKKLIKENLTIKFSSGSTKSTLYIGLFCSPSF